MPDNRMPTAGSPLFGALITGLAVVTVVAFRASDYAHMAWIDGQARMQALGVRLSAWLDRLELGCIDEEEQE